MSLTESQRFHLKKTIKELEQHKGSHTELVSVYVPQGYELVKIVQHLAEEQGTAENIKSTSTRKNVVDALERMIQHLKLFKRTPENGLVVFSGNVAEREGRSDVKVWSIEPPVPLKTRIYRCDKIFVLDILRDMLDIKEVYGLVVIDRRDAIIALLKGKTIIPLLKTHSEVPGKFKAGGQSAARFSRQREGAARDHYRKVAEYMKEQFFHLEGLKGIIVGGPGPTKYDFIEEGEITNELKKKIIAVKDLSYTDEFGLEELLEKSEDVLASEEVIGEKKLMGRFLDTLAKNHRLVSYGENEVMKRVREGMVDTLLVSESIGDEKLEQFEQEAAKMGTTMKIISTETREGAQLRDLGKVAALLRYEAH
ncbi:TPA: peptide chain release factor 1 [Candidatus Woesearchaeota archaeon]|nr:MAG: peptide chain release factor subunit 1 [archaeon GW2011_AR11]HIH05234.1 peptide chain release factor 1 [Candidatus Woesearchaeota archaeon]HIJ18098.1 peptide chain release factor 1 [Candidatus Woesearchaeota archaeon]